MMSIAAVCLFVIVTLIAVGYMNKNGVLPYQLCFVVDKLLLPVI